MNNEEKILAILEQLRDDTNARFDKMDARLDNMQKDITDIQQRVVKVEITQENLVLPKIQLLAEGHTTICDKITAQNERTEDLDDIRNDVDALKYAVRAKLS